MKKHIRTILLPITLTVAIFGTPLAAAAETVQGLPDNVGITASADGTRTTIVVQSKPGFSTQVQRICTNGTCTNSAKNTALSSADTAALMDQFNKQQAALNAFWKAQQDFWNQQYALFPSFFW